MHPLLVITDKEAWNKTYDMSKRQFVYRSAVRAVILDSEQNIAILHVANHDLYTLPGGGIDLGESVSDALHREIREEVGCTISKFEEFAQVLEIKYKPKARFGKIQLNHAFICELDQINGDPEFSDSEIANGSKISWLSLEESIKLLTKVPESDENFTRFSRLRDLHLVKLVQTEL